MWIIIKNNHSLICTQICTPFLNKAFSNHQSNSSRKQNNINNILTFKAYFVCPIISYTNNTVFELFFFSKYWYMQIILVINQAEYSVINLFHFFNHHFLNHLTALSILLDGQTEEREGSKMKTGTKHTFFSVKCPVHAWKRSVSAAISWNVPPLPGGMRAYMEIYSMESEKQNYMLQKQNSLNLP